MITAAHVRQAVAHEHVALRRFARAPELCDARTHGCTSLEIWGGRFVYLAPDAHPDYLVVVLPTIRDAVRIGRLQTAVPRQNVLLLYTRSAKARLGATLRLFERL